MTAEAQAVPFLTKDTGQRDQYASGMQREPDAGRPRFDLLLPEAVPYEQQLLTRCAALMARGAEKYSSRNWEKADSAEEVERMKSSAFRHFMQWMCGEDDEDHAAAVFFNMLAAESTLCVVRAGGRRSTMRNRVTKSNGQVRSMYRRLGREDLVTFDREAKDLVLSAIDQGCLGRISAKGHCILRNNAGGTASVPRNMTTPNRSAQNARADIKRLLREHRQEEALEPEDPSPDASAQRMTVSRAFVEHGAAFSRWFDAQEGGLPADAVVDVAFDSAGLPSFAIGAEQAEDPAAEEPQHQQEPAEQESPAMAEQTTEPTPVDESPEEVLARVRAALGEDPEVARLEARVAELEEALQAERERAERAASRLALIQEAMTA